MQLGGNKTIKQLNIKGGDGFVQLGKYRIGNVDSNIDIKNDYKINLQGGYRFIRLGNWELGITSKDSFAIKSIKTGTHYCLKNNKENYIVPNNFEGNQWSIKNKLLDYPVDVSIGDNFIQFGNTWRIGCRVLKSNEKNISIFEISHIKGTLLRFENNKQIVIINNPKLSLWTKNNNLIGKGISFGENMIKFGDIFYIGDSGLKNGESIFTIYSLINNKSGSLNFPDYSNTKINLMYPITSYIKPTICNYEESDNALIGKPTNKEIYIKYNHISNNNLNIKGGDGFIVYDSINNLKMGHYYSENGIDYFIIFIKDSGIVETELNKLRYVIIDSTGNVIFKILKDFVSFEYFDKLLDYPKNVLIGDKFIEFKQKWRIGINGTNKKELFIISHKNLKNPIVLDEMHYVKINKEIISNQLKGGDGFIRLGNWNIGNVKYDTGGKNYHFGITNIKTNYTMGYRSDGHMYRHSINQGWGIVNKPDNAWHRDLLSEGPTNVKYGDGFIEFANVWRFGRVDDRHFVLSSKDGSLFLWREDGIIYHKKGRNIQNSWTLWPNSWTKQNNKEWSLKPNNLFIDNNVIQFGQNSWRIGGSNTNLNEFIITPTNHKTMKDVNLKGFIFNLNSTNGKLQYSEKIEVISHPTIQNILQEKVIDIKNIYNYYNTLLNKNINIDIWNKSINEKTSEITILDDGIKFGNNIILKNNLVFNNKTFGALVLNTYYININEFKYLNLINSINGPFYNYNIKDNLFISKNSTNNKLKGGDGFIELGKWRIGNYVYNKNYFVISHKDKDYIQFYDVNGFQYIKTKHLFNNIWDKPLLENPTNIKYGKIFIEFGGVWRFGINSNPEMDTPNIQNMNFSLVYKSKQANILIDYKTFLQKTPKFSTKINLNNEKSLWDEDVFDIIDNNNIQINNNSIYFNFKLNLSYNTELYLYIKGSDNFEIGICGSIFYNKVIMFYKHNIIKIHNKKLQPLKQFNINTLSRKNTMEMIKYKLVYKPLFNLYNIEQILNKDNSKNYNSNMLLKKQLNIKNIYQNIQNIQLFINKPIIKRIYNHFIICNKDNNFLISRDDGYGTTLMNNFNLFNNKLQNKSTNVYIGNLLVEFVNKWRFGINQENNIILSHINGNNTFNILDIFDPLNYYIKNNIDDKYNLWQNSAAQKQFKQLEKLNKEEEIINEVEQSVKKIIEYINITLNWFNESIIAATKRLEKYKKIGPKKRLYKKQKKVNEWYIKYIQKHINELIQSKKIYAETNQFNIKTRKLFYKKEIKYNINKINKLSSDNKTILKNTNINSLITQIAKYNINSIQSRIKQIKNINKNTKQEIKEILKKETIDDKKLSYKHAEINDKLIKIRTNNKEFILGDFYNNFVITYIKDNNIGTINYTIKNNNPFIYYSKSNINIYKNMKLNINIYNTIFKNEQSNEQTNEQSNEQLNNQNTDNKIKHHVDIKKLDGIYTIKYNNDNIEVYSIRASKIRSFYNKNDSWGIITKEGENDIEKQNHPIPRKVDSNYIGWYYITNTHDKLTWEFMKINKNNKLEIHQFSNNPKYKYNNSPLGSPYFCCIGIGYELKDVDNGGWTLVRRVKTNTDTWHPATDNLTGIDEYGSYLNNQLSNETFSIKYNNRNYNQFMFATGDGAKWSIVNKNDIFNAIKENTNEESTLNIVRSSINNSPHQIGWINRNNKPEDPWIGLTNNNVDKNYPTINNAGLLYGEGGGNILFNKNEVQRSGLNVYIREKIVLVNLIDENNITKFTSHTNNVLALKEHPVSCNTNIITQTQLERGYNNQSASSLLENNIKKPWDQIRYNYNCANVSGLDYDIKTKQYETITDKVYDTNNLSSFDIKCNKGLLSSFQLKHSNINSNNLIKVGNNTDCKINTENTKLNIDNIFKEHKVFIIKDKKQNTIIYKRITPIPEDFSIYDIVFTNWTTENNVLNKDYKLFNNMLNMENDNYLILKNNYNENMVKDIFELYNNTTNK